MARLDEAGERVVAAEQRVDVVERVGVVAVARRRREERREVQPAGAERLDVVEVGLDARQVAAVDLAHGACGRRSSTGSSHADTAAPTTGQLVAARRDGAKRSGKTW